MSISLQLGYPDGSVEPSLDTARAAKANEIITQLVAIDLALASARLDSMAVQVDKLAVDYVQHMALLKAEGSRLLKELSNVSGLAVVYDRYYGISEVAAKKLSPYMFQSYW